MHVLDVELTNPRLVRALLLDSPLQDKVLATQLLQLAKAYNTTMPMQGEPEGANRHNEDDHDDNENNEGKDAKGGEGSGFHESLPLRLPQLYNMIEQRVNDDNNDHDIDLQERGLEKRQSNASSSSRIFSSYFKNRAWVWVGEGFGFCSAKKAVLKSTIDCRPYIFQPPRLSPGYYRLLLSKGFGVAKELTIEQVKSILHSLASRNRGQPLDVEQIDFVLRLLRFCASVMSGLSKEDDDREEKDYKEDEEEKRISKTGEEAGVELLVPNVKGILTPIRRAMFNDAPWISKGLSNQDNIEFVHASVSKELSSELGIRSFRKALLSQKSGEKDIPCCSVSDLSILLADLEASAALACLDNNDDHHHDNLADNGNNGKSNDGKQSNAGGASNASDDDNSIIKKNEGVATRKEIDHQHDDKPISPSATAAAAAADTKMHIGVEVMKHLIEVGDVAHARRMDVVLEGREFKAQSLFTPLLADFQGPAILVRYDAPLSYETLLLLQTRLFDCYGVDRVVIQGRPTYYGLGTMAAYAFGDVLTVLTAGNLYVFDPLRVCYIDDSKAAAAMKGADGRPPKSSSAAFRTATQGAQLNAPSSSTSSTKDGKEGGGFGKVYSFGGSDLCERFPDQFAPFVKSIFRVSPSSKYPGTILRIPLRKAPSRLSRLVWNYADVSKLLQAMRPRLSRCLLFGQSMESIHLFKQHSEAEAAQLYAQAIVHSSNLSSLRERRQALMCNTEWRHTRSIFNIFAYAPKKIKYRMDIAHRGPSGRTQHDTWLISGSVGVGRTRDLALKFQAEQSGYSAASSSSRRSTFSRHPALEWARAPIAAVAAHLSTNAEPAPCLQGEAFCTLPIAGSSAAAAARTVEIAQRGGKDEKGDSTGTVGEVGCSSTGLPVHVHCLFSRRKLRRQRPRSGRGVGATVINDTDLPRNEWVAVVNDNNTSSPGDNNSSINNSWNSMLVTDCVADAYVELLVEIRNLLRAAAAAGGNDPRTAAAAAAATMRRRGSSTKGGRAGALIKEVYTKAIGRGLFLTSEAKFTKVKQSVFVAATAPRELTGFLGQFKSVFVVPPVLVKDLQKVLSGKATGEPAMSINPAYELPILDPPGTRSLLSKHRVAAKLLHQPQRAIIAILKFVLEDLGPGSYQKIAGLNLAPLQAANNDDDDDDDNDDDRKNADDRKRIRRNSKRRKSILSSSSSASSDARVGSWGVRQYVIANETQQQLLPLSGMYLSHRCLEDEWLRAKLLDPEFLRRFLTPFTPRFFARRMSSLFNYRQLGKHRVVRNWVGAEERRRAIARVVGDDEYSEDDDVENRLDSLAIKTDTGYPSAEWVVRFWAEVPIRDRSKSMLFKIWPLLPILPRPPNDEDDGDRSRQHRPSNELGGSELLSLKLLEHVLCILPSDLPNMIGTTTGRRDMMEEGKEEKSQPRKATGGANSSNNKKHLRGAASTSRGQGRVTEHRNKEWFHDLWIIGLPILDARFFVKNRIITGTKKNANHNGGDDDQKGQRKQQDKRHSSTPARETIEDDNRTSARGDRDHQRSGALSAGPYPNATLERRRAERMVSMLAWGFHQGLFNKDTDDEKKIKVIKTQLRRLPIYEILGGDEDEDDERKNKSKKPHSGARRDGGDDEVRKALESGQYRSLVEDDVDERADGKMMVTYMIESDAKFPKSFYKYLTSTGTFLAYKYPDFYRFLGVRVLGKRQILERFLRRSMNTKGATNTRHGYDDDDDGFNGFEDVRDDLSSRDGFDDAIVADIKQNWQVLRSDDMEQQLRELPFVPAATLSRPNSYTLRERAEALFDPRNRLFAQLFGGGGGGGGGGGEIKDDKHLFPGREYRSDEWLDFLCKIGLKHRVTGAVFVECAKRLEHLHEQQQRRHRRRLSGSSSSSNVFDDTKRGGERSDDDDEDDSTMNESKKTRCDEDEDDDGSDIVSLAETLVSRLWKDEAAFARELPDFWQKVAQIRFVPGKDPHTGFKSFRLYRFSEMAMDSDFNLAWAVRPVLLSRHAPPRRRLKLLGVASPPDKSTVLQNLINLCYGGGSGDSSSSPYGHDGVWKLPSSSSSSRSSPLQMRERLQLALESRQRKPEGDRGGFFHGMMKQIFGYLSSRFEQLDAKDVQMLRQIPIVPVGSLVVKASRLYLRLEDDLFPFMFEVPRVFGAFDSLFRRLGTQEYPRPNDYIRVLEEIHVEARGQPLNINELAAVMKMLRLLASKLLAWQPTRNQRHKNKKHEEEEKEKAFEQANAVVEARSSRRLLVPNAANILVRCGECVLNDSPILARRIFGDNYEQQQKGQLSFVSPNLPPSLCQELGVATLSESVAEVLVEAIPAQSPSGGGGGGAASAKEHLQRLLKIKDSEEFAKGCVRLWEAETASRARDSNILMTDSSSSSSSSSSKFFSEWAALPSAKRVHNALKSLEIHLCSRIKTQLKPKNSWKVWVEGSSGGRRSECVDLFVEDDRKAYVLNSSSTSASSPCSSKISLETLVAVVVQRVLNRAIKEAPRLAKWSGIRMMLELNHHHHDSSSSSKEMVKDVIAHGLDLMQVQTIDKANVLRGQPGQILTAEDENLIKLEPLRSFAKNEVVAIESWEEGGGDEAEHKGGMEQEDEKQQKRESSPKRRQRRKVYRYAIVEAQEKDSLDALSTLTLITALPGSSNNTSSRSSSSSAWNQKQQQQQQPRSNIQKHLSSQVYAFRSELLDSRSLHSSGSSSSSSNENRRVFPSPFHVDSKSLGIIGSGSRISPAHSSKDDNKRGEAAATAGGGRRGDSAGSNVIEAVSSLLSRVNLPISLSQRALMESNMRLQADMKEMQQQMAAVCDARDVLNARLKKIEDSYICHICESNKVDSVLVPCGHLICSTCKRCLRKRECPFCRNAFRSSAKYFSPLEDGSLS
eukprot:jgi/Bigna1/135000/aug1.27_g9708